MSEIGRIHQAYSWSKHTPCPIVTSTVWVLYTNQDTHHTNDVHQLGAKGDVQLRRGPDGYLIVPEKTKFGSKTLSEYIVQSKFL